MDHRLGRGFRKHPGLFSRFSSFLCSGITQWANPVTVIPLNPKPEGKQSLICGRTGRGAMYAWGLYANQYDAAGILETDCF